MLLARWIVGSVPLEIVGGSGHEKVPRSGATRRTTKREDRAARTCGPHSDSFNDMSKRRRSNYSTNNFQTPCRSKS
ncbi:hypothetical protein TNCV_480491 [Trichonephila clavipes]|nr:hypothetical protein TNCV_480491 [Trichonephila clavipes]